MIWNLNYSQQSSMRIKEWVQVIKNAIFPWNSQIDQLPMALMQPTLLISFNTCGRHLILVNKSDLFKFSIGFTHNIKHLEICIDPLGIARQD